MTPTAHVRPATPCARTPMRRSPLWGGPVRTGQAATTPRAMTMPSLHRDPLVDLVADAADAARLGLLFP